MYRAGYPGLSLLELRMSPCMGLTGCSRCSTWRCQLCLAMPRVNWLFLKQLTSLWVCFQHCSPELAAAHLSVPAQRFLACTRTSCRFSKLAETCHPIPSPLTSQTWHAKSHHFKLLQASSCCESSLSPALWIYFDMPIPIFKIQGEKSGSACCVVHSIISLW